MTRIKTQRVYAGAPGGWHSILVDRLWPRGIAKEDLDVTWLKEVGPSTELRTWFGHDPEKFDEFAERYRAELDGSAAFDELLTEVRDYQQVALLFGAKDEEHNQAVVLADLLREKL